VRGHLPYNTFSLLLPRRRPLSGCPSPPLALLTEIVRVLTCYLIFCMLFCYTRVIPLRFLRTRFLPLTSLILTSCLCRSFSASFGGIRATSSQCYVDLVLNAIVVRSPRCLLFFARKCSPASCVSGCSLLSVFCGFPAVTQDCRRASLTGFAPFTHLRLCLPSDRPGRRDQRVRNEADFRTGVPHLHCQREFSEETSRIK